MAPGGLRLLPTWCQIKEYHLRADGTFRRDTLLEGFLRGVSEALGMELEDMVLHLGHHVGRLLGAKKPWLGEYISRWRQELRRSDSEEVEECDFYPFGRHRVVASDWRAMVEFRAMVADFGRLSGKNGYGDVRRDTRLAADLAVACESARNNTDGIRVLTEADAGEPAHFFRGASPSTPASERAMDLLRSHLSDEQRAELLETDSFTVIAESGRIYRISAHTCCVVSPKDRRTPLESLCVHWANWTDEYALPSGQADIPPVGDMMLRCKLLIEADEEAFRRDANVTLTDPRAGNVMAKAEDLLAGLPRASKRDMVRGLGAGLGDVFRNIIDSKKWAADGFAAIQEARKRRESCTTSPV